VTTLGFVGLGTMGGRIARRLLDAGYPVHGYNRTPERAAWLEGHGLVRCLSPADVAERSEVVLSMVSNTAALEAVVGGAGGLLDGLRPGAVLVDMSTVSPEASRRLAERVHERGATMLDAPVSGSVVTLEQGRLSIMVGGDRRAFERVEPVLRAIGPVVTYVGGNGQAVLMKIAINLSLAVQMLAFSEGVLIAEKGGIDRAKAVEVLLSSVVASPMIAYRGPFVVSMPEEAWFDVDMMQKDLQLALEAARELDVPMPATAAANEMLTAARGMGMAKRDFATVFHALARMAGLPGADGGSGAYR
jgi:3-hydroxyisobutyrate dehydrogenase-like beta-hydroxyacid dehydrogenase